jgi:gas vesicle protein
MARREQQLLAEIDHWRRQLTGHDNRARSLPVFLGGFALGALCGAALALILAPQAGEETREQIHRTGVQVQGRATAMAGQVRQEASALEGQAQAALEHARERAHSLASQADDQAKSIASSAKETPEAPSLAAGGESAQSPRP